MVVDSDVIDSLCSRHIFGVQAGYVTDTIILHQVYLSVFISDNEHVKFLCITDTTDCCSVESASSIIFLYAFGVFLHGKQRPVR